MRKGGKEGGRGGRREGSSVNGNTLNQTTVYTLHHHYITLNHLPRTSRVELNKLHILIGQSGPGDHGRAISRAGVS